MEIGTVINVGQNALDPMEQGQKYTFIADETSYYGISVEGGYVGIIAPNGSVNWTTYYETKLNLGYSYTFMVRGEGVESVPAAPSEGAAKKIKINIEAVAYDLVLNEGTNTVTMKPAKEYDISFGEYFQRDENGEYAQKTEQKLDSNGKPILDDNKEPVYVPVYDENGNYIPNYMTSDDPAKANYNSLRIEGDGENGVWYTYAQKNQTGYKVRLDYYEYFQYVNGFKPVFYPRKRTI